jgi:hypothetical protein
MEHIHPGIENLSVYQMLSYMFNQIILFKLRIKIWMSCNLYIYIYVCIYIFFQIILSTVQNLQDFAVNRVSFSLSCYSYLVPKECLIHSVVCLFSADISCWVSTLHIVHQFRARIIQYLCVLLYVMAFSLCPFLRNVLTKSSAFLHFESV